MAADTGSAWLRCYRPLAAPRLRLVCFPHAGGAASAYHGWPRLLPADVELHAVQYPGRQDRLHEPCVTDMAELADAVAAALGPMLHRPVALFGHSMGASVAHEVALRLPGPGPAGLFVSARRPPRLHRPRDVGDGDAALLADVRGLDPASSTVLNDPDLRAMMLPAIRADYRLADDYRPSSPGTVGAPVTAYVGDRDPCVNVWQMRAWSEITDSDFDLTVFPGDHFYLRAHEADLVHDVARRLDSPVLGRMAVERTLPLR
jgi:pyochelin biosynthetic protein PchC